MGQKRYRRSGVSHSLLPTWCPNQIATFVERPFDPVYRAIQPVESPQVS
jgi:hypothetical protein